MIFVDSGPVRGLEHDTKVRLFILENDFNFTLLMDRDKIQHTMVRCDKEIQNWFYQRGTEQTLPNQKEDESFHESIKQEQSSAVQNTL